MKLSEHVEHIRQLIAQSFENRLGRMGITPSSLLPIDSIPPESRIDRKRMESIREVFIAETGSVGDAFEKLVEELTFTLFNRLAALKVMEAHTLHPEIVTRRESHGGRSFAHLAWLEQHPEFRQSEAEGLIQFFEDQLDSLSSDIPLFSTSHPYHLMPTALELLGIIQAFNGVETDSQVEVDVWKSDDVLGWLYESYNNFKKSEHKLSGNKTEYHKVSIQSQVYTPRWVVQFLVDNSLGKLYLEMYPNSEIRHRYKIANAPHSQSREIKPLHEVKMIDPSTGSGNFLLYGFDLFYDLYLDQIENYGADYNERDIPKLIVENNLYGVDLDDRAIQLAQLGLYIKAKRKKRTAKVDNFNVVSSDFFLPAYDQVKDIFEDGQLGEREKRIIEEVWADLQNAHKFGTLVRIDEKLTTRWFGDKPKKNPNQIDFFEEENKSGFESFREEFFNNLQEAVAKYAERQGETFLSTKTQDAITFLRLISQQYDVAVANPPYTDNADFGPELKKFVEANYKQPYKFNSNLYAVFIKRCYELAHEGGKIALIHPLTFMYIKTFQDVRKFILEKTHISIFVDYGLSNLFGAVMVDPAFYVLEKEKNKGKGTLFISLDQYTRTPNEKHKKEFCLKSLYDFINSEPNKHNYLLPQEKLKIIDGWPFIYWISDGFREKFNDRKLKEVFPPKSGLATSNNDRFLRFWWEIEFSTLSQNIIDKKKWKFYSKGGPFNKWFGNLWTVVNWGNNAMEMRNTGQAVFRNEAFYLKEGITYSASGSKGATFRFLPENCIYDVGGASMFKLDADVDSDYILALLNSHVSYYIIDCLNPTVNTQVGDIERIPYVAPSNILKSKVTSLTKFNIKSKQALCAFRIFESNFRKSSLLEFKETSLKDRAAAYLNFENTQLSQVLINEALINELIFEVYELSDADREQVEAKMGISIGALPVLQEAKDAFLAELLNPLSVVSEHIQNLPISIFDEHQVREIKEGFATLYQSNNDLEEFCIRHQVNPINVWYWFKETNVVPAARAAEIALEFLADSIRTLLQQDEDGIIPLVGLPGEEALSQRLEQHCLHNGFTAAQFIQLDSLLGRNINDYLENHFFNELSNHLNLFMYLPKTPFIWHLTSGEYKGFDAYISIYKWNRDSLFKLKTRYINTRIENLEYRQIQLQGVTSAQAQAEKELIRHQLDEIQMFLSKIDELIAEGYDPKLDDGVAKNIAPLQKKGMLRAEVLKTTGGKKSQLEKYLNADW